MAEGTICLFDRLGVGILSSAPQISEQQIIVLPPNLPVSSDPIWLIDMLMFADALTACVLYHNTFTSDGEIGGKYCVSTARVLCSHKKCSSLLHHPDGTS